MIKLSMYEKNLSSIQGHPLKLYLSTANKSIGYWKGMRNPSKTIFISPQMNTTNLIEKNPFSGYKPITYVYESMRWAVIK